MLKDIRYQDSFTAYDEAGNEYTVEIFVEIHDAGTLEEPNAEVEGLRQLKTTSGDHVNRIEEGKYEILQAGAVIPVESRDKNAP